MAESKSSLLAKSVQKHAGRAKEKLLQNLGKVDRTADEIFDEHLVNFNRQQTNANRLQKEFNNYIRCIRAVQASSKLLTEAISDVYEMPWTGAETLHAQITSIESLWADFSHKLGDQVLIPLNTYTAQFPEMKKKIEKRSRKLIDYDSQRHSFQNLQANSNKRRDDVKVTKGREQLEEARRTYEILNTELHDELPALHDSRILFLVTNLQTLFASEQVFHSETSKIFADLEAVVDKLASDSQRGSYTIKKINAGNLNSPTQHSPSQTIGGQLTNGGSSPNANSLTSSVSSSTPSPPQSLHVTGIGGAVGQFRAQSEPAAVAQSSINKPSHTSDEENDADPEYQNTSQQLKPAPAGAAASTPTTPATTPSTPSTPSTPASPTTTAAVALNSQNNNTLDVEAPATAATTTTSATPPARTSVESNAAVRSIIEAEYANGNVVAADANGKDHKAIANGGGAAVAAGTADAVATTAGATEATTAELPPGALYRVKATYKYLKEDVDELSFEVGDLICVIEYDDPEDQEEGWLMGFKEGTTEKGLFPANFTRPL